MDELTNFQGETAYGNASGAKTGRDAVEMLIANVGERVRNARQRKGLSRRVLSELSGVSPRYLAQLEMGAGNISIGLLLRVANALDHRIEWLVSEDDPWTSEATHIANLFRSATAEQRRKVLEVLSPEHPRFVRANRICFIGLRGAGKSTLGRLTAKRFAVPFMELNREIEEQSGMPVDEVIALYGQEGYRRLERQAVERVVAVSDAVVLAVAGGIVSEPETYNYLLRNFHTIWLKARPEEHMGRVRAQGDERPMAGNPKAMEELRSILTSREQLYARAEASIDTSGRSIEQCVEEVVRVIEREGFMKRQ